MTANLIASENHKQISPLIDADILGDFLHRSRRFGTLISFPVYVQAILHFRVRHFEKSCDKIAQPDWLTLVPIRSDGCKKSRKRAYLVNAGKFNRRYLTCQILVSAILYADRGDRRKSLSLHRAHLVIFSDCCDRRIKSPGMSVGKKCIEGVLQSGPVYIATLIVSFNMPVLS